MSDPTTIAADRHVSLEAVNDRAKLIMHRLVARRLAHDPALLDAARTTVARLAANYPDSSFPAEWRAVLDLSPNAVRRKLTGRGQDMQRLRLSSPFLANDGTALFSDSDLRRRIWRLARKGAVERGFRTVART